ncbi:MAG: sugar ABC transporter permease [Clostridiaceae bacterium]
MNKLSMSAQKKITIAAFLAIPVTLLLAFHYYPAVKLIYYSFTSWDGLSAEKELIGFGNYIRIFTESELYTPFFHNGILFICGLVQLVMALVFAIMLNTGIKGRNAYKTILFMPYVINSVAIAFIFNFFFNTSNGAFNFILKGIGLKSLALDWLGNPGIVNWVLGFMSLWKYMGYMMIIFLAALQSIPQEMLEAGDIDGTNTFQKLKYLILPSIKSIVILNLFLNLNGALSAFEFQFIMWPDVRSPLGMADTFMTKTINTAFGYSDFGLASAMGVVLVVIVAVLTIIQNKIVLGEGAGHE